MKLLYFVLEFIVLICMIVLVHMKADVRMIIEAGFIYLAMVIMHVHEAEGEE